MQNRIRPLCPCCQLSHFNPPTPCGVGRSPGTDADGGKRFQSTHPVRGGTINNMDSLTQIVFQSTHPVRGGTRTFFNIGVVAIFQSTHPVRGGTRRPALDPIGMLFQSTHPVRGGTSVDSEANYTGQFQSTHPVRGGTPLIVLLPVDDLISIHPPRAGWDIIIGL